MFHSASVQQEHGLVHDFISHIDRFAFDSRFFSFGSDNYTLALSNYLHFNVTKQSVCSASSLSLKLGGRGNSNLNFRRSFNDFNTAIRFHTQKLPIGFDSPSLDSGDNSDDIAVLRNVIAMKMKQN
ncbi:hypothetical protein HN51_002593 [Arachis hypogaea]